MFSLYNQLMVNCWFGGPVVWIPGIPENDRDWMGLDS